MTDAWMAEPDDEPPLPVEPPELYALPPIEEPEDLDPPGVPDPPPLHLPSAFEIKQAYAVCASAGRAYVGERLGGVARHPCVRSCPAPNRRPGQRRPSGLHVDRRVPGYGDGRRSRRGHGTARRARPGGRVERIGRRRCSIERLDPEGHSILYGTGGCGKGTQAASWIVQLTKARPSGADPRLREPPGRVSSPDLSAWGGAEALAASIVAPLTAALGRRARAALEAGRGSPPAGRGDGLDVHRHELDRGRVRRDGPAETGDAGPVRRRFSSSSACRPCRSPTSTGPRTSATRSARRSGTTSRAPPGASSVKVRPVRSSPIASTTTTRASGGSRSRWHRSTTFPRELWEKPYSAVLADRIAEVLEDEALTVAQIVGRLADDEELEAAKDDSVRKALRRGLPRTASVHRRRDGLGCPISAGRAVIVSRFVSRGPFFGPRSAVPWGVPFVSRGDLDPVPSSVRDLSARQPVARDGTRPPL